MVITKGYTVRLQTDAVAVTMEDSALAGAGVWRRTHPARRAAAGRRDRDQGSPDAAHDGTAPAIWMYSYVQ